MLPAQEQAPNSYAAPQPHHRPPRPGKKGQPPPQEWEGGLDDLFAVKGKAPTSFASQSPADQDGALPRAAPTPNRARGQPANAGEWGGGLGDVLQKPNDDRHRYGRPEAEGADRAPTPKRASTPGCGSLDDAFGAKAPANNSFGRGDEGGGHGHFGEAGGGGGFGGGSSEHHGSGSPHGGSPPRGNGGGGNGGGSAKPAADPWAGVSLGDALGSRAAANAPASSSSAQAASKPPPRVVADGSKPTADIVTWLKSLPPSHVPDKAREDLATIVEQGGMNGTAFSEYVKTAAWKNVLAEKEAQAICRANLDYLEAAPKKGGVKVNV
mmetsp:Transcript_124800/g.398950  ORF Transcript_124800/g.398950 Transcript_124800/m.398950 type:complete len:324 (+) Transcript_124800:228-1199(+)